MNFITTTLGRLLFAIPFGVFGIFHFLNANMMKDWVPIPPQIVWIYVTGAALIAASISMLINKKAKLASLLLGAMLLIFVLTLHLPGALGGDQMSMTNLLKDLALSGAAFMYSGHAKD